MTSEQHAWILYDGRAEGGGTESASVLEFAGQTHKELQSALKFWKGHDGVLVEYRRYDDGAVLTDERIIGHLREGAESLLARCSRE